MSTPTREDVADTAIALHAAWVMLVNFRHPKMFSSRMEDALEARKARRVLQDAYDAAFSRLTAVCELYRQGK